MPSSSCDLLPSENHPSHHTTRRRTPSSPGKAGSVRSVPGRGDGREASAEGWPTLPRTSDTDNPAVTVGHILRCDDGRVGKRVLLAAPRGYCAGVERAVEAVERALS